MVVHLAALSNHQSVVVGVAAAAGTTTATAAPPRPAEEEEATSTTTAPNNNDSTDEDGGAGVAVPVQRRQQQGGKGIEGGCGEPYCDNADGVSDADCGGPTVLLGLDDVDVGLPDDVVANLLEDLKRHYRLALHLHQHPTQPNGVGDSEGAEPDPSPTTAAADARGARQAQEASASASIEEEEEARRHLDRIVGAMKRPPGTTTLRINGGSRGERRGSTAGSSAGSGDGNGEDDDDDDDGEEEESVLAGVEREIGEWLSSSSREYQRQDDDDDDDEREGGGATAKMKMVHPRLTLQSERHPILDDVLAVTVVVGTGDSTAASPPTTVGGGGSSGPAGRSAIAAAAGPGSTGTSRWPLPAWVAHGRNNSGEEEAASAAMPAIIPAVLVDCFCGEAVLRGSDVFVGGVLGAGPGIRPRPPGHGGLVAVYADLPPPPAASREKKKRKANGLNNIAAAAPVTRGMRLERYGGRCVFLGMGTAACGRSEMLSKRRGVAVRMSPLPWHRAGPVLPPLGDLSALASSRAFLQNLPSMAVGHALLLDTVVDDAGKSRRGAGDREFILDMCAAPGGKTSHLATLLAGRNRRATIVACDKSRRKMVACRTAFRKMGFDDGPSSKCGVQIVPLALDTTECVVAEEAGGEDGDDERKSVAEVLASAKLGFSGKGEDGGEPLLEVDCFYPESFHRILLDPPCSALGLRPRLQASQMAPRRSIESHAGMQRRLVRCAVRLLKPGGVLTYSTCTVGAEENERMVRHVLDEHGGAMRLVDVGIAGLGGPGWAGAGLDEEQRGMVRRFDPGAPEGDNRSGDDDTIGFFIAKFKKSPSCCR